MGRDGFLSLIVVCIAASGATLSQSTSSAQLCMLTHPYFTTPLAPLIYLTRPYRLII